MRTRYDVVNFAGLEEPAAVVFSEPVSKEETSAIVKIPWGAKEALGDHCSFSESYILYICPCDDERGAKQLAEGIATIIDQIIESEISKQESAVLDQGIRDNEEQIESLGKQVKVLDEKIEEDDIDALDKTLREEEIQDIFDNGP